MPELRELQLAFVNALFDETDEAVNAHVREDGTAASARLDIYRNNLREGFIKALAIGFPVIERLVGKDYFRQLALEFLQAHPSRSGDLHHIGKPFAPFLRDRFERTQYACFADVAALEWAHQEAQIAADAVALSPDAFRDIDPAEYELLTFEFHPACHFVRSRFPVVRIWRANQPPSRGDEAIDLASGADNVLVLRTPECVEFHCLPDAAFSLFEALKRGENLGTALEIAQSLERAFDLGAALRHLMDLQILTGVRRPDPQMSQVQETAMSPTHKPPIEKTDEEWKRELTPDQFRVLREHGTERAGTSPLNDEHREGVFKCAACGEVLFDSGTKYDSGSGWPSFYMPRPGAVDTQTDRSHFMTRVEVHCAKCGGHLGHVFPDGPKPTGQRYCMNGVALDFQPAQKETKT